MSFGEIGNRSAEEVIRLEMDDPDLRGVYYTEEGQPMLDRRYTADAIALMGLDPRTADLNLIGDAIMPIPASILPPRVPQQAATRGSVKSELLERGLPGVNL